MAPNWWEFSPIRFDEDEPEPQEAVTPESLAQLFSWLQGQTIGGGPEQATVQPQEAVPTWMQILTGGGAPGGEMPPPAPEVSAAAFGALEPLQTVDEASVEYLRRIGGLGAPFAPEGQAPEYPYTSPRAGLPPQEGLWPYIESLSAVERARPEIFPGEKFIGQAIASPFNLLDILAPAARPAARGAAAAARGARRAAPRVGREVAEAAAPLGRRLLAGERGGLGPGEYLTDAEWERMITHGVPAEEPPRPPPLGPTVVEKRIGEIESEIASLKEFKAQRPELHRLTPFVNRRTGELGSISAASVRKLTGQRLGGGRKSIRWDEGIFDELAKDMGYDSDEALKFAIEDAYRTDERIRALERARTGLEMAPRTTVQTGLPGMGAEEAQAQMLQEFGRAEGTGAGMAGRRAPLIEPPTIGPGELPGQAAMPEAAAREPWQMTRAEIENLGELAKKKQTSKVTPRIHPQVRSLDELQETIAAFQREGTTLFERVTPDIEADIRRGYSTNYATGQREAGLSVNEYDPLTTTSQLDIALLHHSHGVYAPSGDVGAVKTYLLTGDTVGRGADNEPLLSAGSLKVIAEVMHSTSRGAAVFADLGRAARYVNPWARHRRFIQEALAERRPVPPEVLADYPDLAARAAPEPPTPPVRGEGVAEAPIAPPGAKQFPPLEDNYRKPLVTYTDSLYRETNIDNSLSFVKGGRRMDMSQDDIFMSNVPHLALGQGENKGVLIEFSTEGLSGRVNTQKPAWDFLYNQNEAEFIARYNQQDAYVDAVRAITLRADATGSPSATTRLRRLLEDWPSQANPDGSVTYTKPTEVPPEAPVAGPPESIAPPAAPPPREPPAPPTGAEPPVEPPGRPEPRIVGKSDVTRFLTKFDDDVSDTVWDLYQRYPDEFEAARRGVISDAEVDALAAKAGMSPEEFVRRWKPGTAGNAETIRMLEGALDAATRNVIDLAEAGKAGADATADHLRLRGALLEQFTVQEALHGVRAEAGRALRQFRRQVDRGLASGDVDVMKRILKRLDKRQAPSDDAIQKMMQLDMGDPVSVMAFLRQARKWTTAEKVQSYWIANILSGVRTQVRNTVSNTAFGLGQIPIKALRGLVDIPVAAAQRRPREFYMSEAFPAAMAYFQGLPAGLRKASHIMQHGFDIEDATKLEFPRYFEFSGAWSPFNIPGRMLTACDAMFKTMAFQSELAALATRRALKEGLKGDARVDRITQLLEMPPDDLVEAAGKFAKMTTFTDDPDQVIRAASRLRGLKVPGTDIEPMRYIIPFLNTPWNLTKRGLEWSPLGWASLPFKKGAEVSEAASRALFGSGLLLTGGALYAGGNLTGAAPRNPAERDEFYRLGKQPWSIRIGDRWVSLNMIAPAPLNMPFVMAASMGDAIKAKPDGDFAEQLMVASAVVGQSVMDQSFFRGLDNLMEAITNPAYYAQRLGGDILGGLVPFSSLQRNIAQAFDPLIRDPEGIPEKLAAGIPWLSQNIVPRLNALGQPIERRGGSGFMAFMPSAMPEATGDAVTTEMARLDVTPGFVGKTLTIGDEKIRLNKEQERQYQMLAGQHVAEGVAALVESSAYQGMTDEQKQTLMGKVVRHGRDVGRNEIKARIQGESPEHTLASAKRYMGQYAEAIGWTHYYDNAGDLWLPEGMSKDDRSTALSGIRAAMRFYSEEMMEALAIVKPGSYETAELTLKQRQSALTAMRAAYLVSPEVAEVLKRLEAALGPQQTPAPTPQREREVVGVR